MDPGRFFASSKVLIVAGKGGVGKTTLAATCATAVARLGLSVLLVEVGGRSAAAPMLGVDAIGYEPVRARADLNGGIGIRARSVTPDEALIEWLRFHGFERMVERMVRSGLLEVIAASTPGIKDLLVLGRIRNLEQTESADVIIVDAPASGQALGLLRAPVSITAIAQGGTIHRQARAARDMLSDARRCRVMLVTVASETPVSELIETAFAIEDEVDVALTPVVVNATLGALRGLDADISSAAAAAASLTAAEVADLRTAAGLRSDLWTRQQAQLARLGRRLPLEQIRLPHLFGADLDPNSIDLLADSLLAGIESLPESVLL